MWLLPYRGISIKLLSLCNPVFSGFFGNVKLLLLYKMGSFECHILFYIRLYLFNNLVETLQLLFKYKPFI